MNILVTGGAGYIGSHIVKELLKTKHEVIVYDNLQKGHRESVQGGTFVLGDLADKELLDDTFKKYGIDAVIHMAADSLVGESMVEPAKYFRNNIVNGLKLLDVMRENKVDKLVFSSTAAVYGEPETAPITEEFPNNPTNVYGKTKLMYEEILGIYDRAYKIKSISLRYFNAAGADVSGEIGEDHDPETHLIPIVLQAALGLRSKVDVFGADYPTPDGTCIRDYIHVTDLAEAHILALEALEQGAGATAYNLGSGQGYSVKEIIDVARKVTGQEIKVEEAPRRPGDPAVLVASSDKIKKELGWRPRYQDIEAIISSAWKWHESHPGGYKKYYKR